MAFVSRNGLMTRSLLYSFLLGLAVFPFFGLGILGIIYSGFFPSQSILSFSQNLLFYAFGVYLLLFVLMFLRFFVLLPFFPLPQRVVKNDDLGKISITVAMTAYNDEGVIGNCVKDFLSHPLVKEVIVVDNNSRDNTGLEAKKAGARVIREQVQGFGSAALRALKEAAKSGNFALVVEGDQTFIARDIDKLVSYLRNADMVTATRTTRELSTPDSQVTSPIQYGNLFIAKLLQLKYWNTVRLTDVGGFMRLIRPDSLRKVLPRLRDTGNAFACHMIDMFLKQGYRVIEVPVYFKKRGGTSKGIGSNFIKGIPAGLKMIWGIIAE